MDATNLVGVINLTMAQTAVGGAQHIESLNVTVGNLVNLTSAGNADFNEIDQAQNINANMAITGPKELHIGLQVAYDFAGGIIDASTQGTAGQNGLQIAIGAGSQTVVTGVGNDFVAVTTSDAVDQINIATGGSDIVRFDDLFLSRGQPNPGGKPRLSPGPRF